MGCMEHSSNSLLKLMILFTWDGCLRVSLEVPKGSQATCSVWCGSWGGYGANAREIGLISIWFWVPRAVLHSWGYIRVLLVLWLCCWGLSGVQSSKSRLFTSLIGKTQLLWTQCRESRLISQGGESLMCFLELRQEPGLYSRVTAGMPIRNSSLFIEVRNMSMYEGQLRNVN